MSVIKGESLIDPYFNIACLNGESYTIPNCIFAISVCSWLFHITEVGGVYTLKVLTKQTHETSDLIEDENLRDITNAFIYQIYVVFCSNDGVKYVCDLFKEKLIDVYPSSITNNCIGLSVNVPITTDMTYKGFKINGFSKTCCWNGKKLYYQCYGHGVRFLIFQALIDDAFVHNVRVFGVLCGDKITMIINREGGEKLKQTLPGRWLTAPILMKDILYAVDVSGAMICLACVWDHYDVYRKEVVGSSYIVEMDKEMLYPTEPCSYLSNRGRSGTWLLSDAPIFHGWKLILNKGSKSAGRR